MGNGRRYIPRLIEGRIRAKLAERPVVIVEGAKQVGKTTTVQKICSDLGGTFLSLDDLDTFEEAQGNPKGLLAVVEGSSPVVIDEIQRMPKLILEVKRRVDIEQRPGMFILTGSSDRYRMVTKREPLTGRATSMVMRPLCQAEIGGRDPGTSPGVIRAMYDGTTPPAAGGADLAGAVALGGFPKCVMDPRGKPSWFDDYFNRDLALHVGQTTKSQSLTAISRFLRIAAARLGKQANIQDIAREMSKSTHAASSLYDIIRNSYLIEPLFGHGTPYRKVRLASRPKLFLNDTGLATSMLGIDGADVTKTRHWGALLENFVLNELRTDMELNLPRTGPDIEYFTEHGGLDIDLIVSYGQVGEVMPIEVKATRNVTGSDTRNLRRFQEIAGKRCRRVVVMHGGDEFLELHGGVQAWPIASLFGNRGA